MHTRPSTPIDRRSVLRTALASAAAASGVGALAACSGSPGAAAAPTASGSAESGPAGLVLPTDPVVAQVEAARATTGRTVPVALDAVAGPVDLGGPMVTTWSYGGVVPGQAVRVTKGDIVQATLTSHLPDPTSVHWHGVALRNDMDGVPPVTQAAVTPGATFTYRFVAENPGTYWFHPHVGTQLDRGLYAPLIVEDPGEPADYDQDWTVVLDDWIDGTGHTPDQVLASLRQGMGSMGGMGGMPSGSPLPTAAGTGMPGMANMAMTMPPTPMPSTPMATGMPPGMGSMPGMTASPGTGGGADVRLSGAGSPLLGGDAGDVRYPYYLINGRVPTAPTTLTGKPGQRVRLRIINAGGDTAFRVALGGHTMTVTHTDGFPVVPVPTRCLLIGMGERYDVQITLGDGAFPLVALAEGKNATALAVIRTATGRAPDANVRPAELDAAPLGYAQLRPAAAVALPDKTPDVTSRLVVTGNMATYSWAMNGQTYDPAHPLALVRQGQRVRITWVNQSTMWHPMHLHGHTFQVSGPAGGTGPRKDTVIVLPNQSVTCDFDADNPGQWMAHCHNVYHQEAGLMGVIGYQQ